MVLWLPEEQTGISLRGRLQRGPLGHKRGLFLKAGADTEGYGSFALTANGSGHRHAAQGAVMPSAGSAQFQI